jgi:hypothetical protein
MTGPRIGTELALLVDAGSAWTKASVIGRSRGRWRLLTHTAQPASWGSTELHRRLAVQLEAVGDPRLAGRWDDLLARATRIECHSPERQPRLALVAVSRELSGSTARRVAEAAGWQVEPMVTLDDGRSLADRLWTLQSAEVDAWLVVGGFDDASSPRALETAALAAAARRPDSGTVVWAGSAQLADEVVPMFERDAASVVANPRPSARGEDPGPLRARLEEIARTLAGGSDARHLATVSLPRAVGALAADGGLAVTAIDIGARSAMRVAASPDGAASVRVSATGGLAGVSRIPGAAGRVTRATSDAGDEASVADLLQTLRAHPSTVPQLPEELAATQAAARLAIAAISDDASGGGSDLLIGRGLPLAAAPRPSQAVRMLLDGARPVGVTQLALDAAALLGPLGSLDDEGVREGLGLLAEDLLVPLGTSVVTRGGEPGQLAMRVSVHRTGWPEASPITVRVGQVQVVPLARGVTAELTIELGPRVTLGGGRRSSSARAMATGGAVGLVLDGRGAPMALPRRAEDRRALLGAWADALGREPERNP